MPESKRAETEEDRPLRRLLHAVARPPPAERYSRPRVASRQAVTAACDTCRKQMAKVYGFRMPQDLQMESSLIRIGSALVRGQYAVAVSNGTWLAIMAPSPARPTRKPSNETTKTNKNKQKHTNRTKNTKRNSQKDRQKKSYRGSEPEPTSYRFSIRSRLAISCSCLLFCLWLGSDTISHTGRCCLLFLF